MYPVDLNLEGKNQNVDKLCKLYFILNIHTCTYVVVHTVQH